MDIAEGDAGGLDCATDAVACDGNDGPPEAGVAGVIEEIG